MTWENVAQVLLGILITGTAYTLKRAIETVRDMEADLRDHGERIATVEGFLDIERPERRSGRERRRREKSE